MSADGEFLQADYPILPTRRRFWEHVLRALDRGGTHSQLRTQLRMAQEAAKSVGTLPLGHVVGADFIFDQQSSGMLQSGILPKDTNEDILKLRKEGAAGELQARIAAVVFMIDRLREVDAELGVVADATTIGDLLVADLTAPSAGFRNQVKEALTAMADAGRLAATDGAYSLVNEETQVWLGDFKARSSAIEGDAGRGRRGTRRGRSGGSERRSPGHHAGSGQEQDATDGRGQLRCAAAGGAGHAPSLCGCVPSGT